LKFFNDLEIDFVDDAKMRRDPSIIRVISG